MTQNLKPSAVQGRSLCPPLPPPEPSLPTTGANLEALLPPAQSKCAPAACCLPLPLCSSSSALSPPPPKFLPYLSRLLQATNSVSLIHWVSVLQLLGTSVFLPPKLSGHFPNDPDRTFFRLGSGVPHILGARRGYGSRSYTQCSVNTCWAG